MTEPLITNDAIVFGLLCLILGAVFYTQTRAEFKGFYSIVPGLLLCYFIPSVFSSLNVISGEKSQIYFVASRYLLPACLVLLTLSVDFKAILRLGPKALIMFITGTVGIVLGGPFSFYIFSKIHPSVVGGEGFDAVWRGMTTIAGSWIGGSANQNAMKEVFHVGDAVFSSMIAVDVIVANVWMACLLFMAGRSEKIDAWTGADNSAIHELRERVEKFEAKVAKIPNLTDLMLVIMVGFGITGLSHLAADWLAPTIEAAAPGLKKFSLTSQFFWLVVFATTGGLVLSFTKARNLEGAGASKMGSLFLYILIASIGMKMDISAIFHNPWLFGVGALWILFHVVLLLAVGYFIKAPLFFVAVGSQANIGGAASAPVVASAFHPSLAPVGVLLAVLGYALGTYGAWLCGQILRWLAGA
ncbi:MAG: DUF819 family protein [Acidobacteria bacterium]|nr:DUF819 family protein [Acidobacteriota bacterium]MCB9397337.1 DUF819 family protein [Acidobacteriota bacterium]